MTERPSGSIITAVAVLETHMLSAAAASINAPTMTLRRVPARRRRVSARRRCRPQRSMVSAIMNPPMKRKMIGSA